MQCVEFTPCFGLRMLVVAGGQVIQVENDPVSSCGMITFIDPMEAFLPPRLKLQINVASKQSQ